MKKTTKPKKETLKYETIVPRIQGIISQYSGMRLTVRQIYYRLVAGQIVKNSQQSYKSVGEMLTKARRAGDIAYTDIEDRTRGVQVGDRTEKSAKDYFHQFFDELLELEDYYSLPYWWNQPKVPLVFVEKEALASVFEQVTKRYAVDLIVCRGYPSLTQLYELSERLKERFDGEAVQEFVPLYFGDYDPSGLDIQRSVQDNMENDFEVSLDVGRVAITLEQIRKYNIPPAPAKATDSRTEGMRIATGQAMQVELDAIEPRQLQTMIKDAILACQDPAIKGRRDREQQRRREKIKTWVSQAVDRDFRAMDDDDGEDEGEDDAEGEDA